jgi:dTDP-4-dehydrorhamnose reductase
VTRVLVTGAGGRLGGRLAAHLAERFEVVAARRESPLPEGLATVPLDLLSASSFEEALEAARPDAVVHAAAMADPDACERQPEQARAVNTTASETIARLCRRRAIPLVVVSTDLVFDGGHPGWREDDSPAPLMTYGRTKLEGERAALAEHPAAAVARVALVCGRGHGHHGTSSESVAWGLQAGRRLRLYTDQFRTPVDAESAARALARILETGATGLFHVGGPERVSRHELGVRTARLLGLDVRLIEAVTSIEHPAGAPRPADVSLDSSRAARELGWRARPLDAALAESRPTADARP